MLDGVLAGATLPRGLLPCYSVLNLFRLVSEQGQTAGPELVARGERDDATKREKSRVSQEHISGPWNLNHCVVKASIGGEVHNVACSRAEGN
jgi:hypothetical protein